MSAAAYATIEEREAARVARISGEIDLATAEGLREQIFSSVMADAKPVVIDLTDTGYLDSSGVRLLYDLVEQLRARGQPVAIVVADEAVVRRVMVLTKLDDVVPLYPRIDEALAALAL